MPERRIVPAASGVAFWLKRGDALRIIDIEGGQTGDLVALSSDGQERQSNGRTFDYCGKIYLSTGDTLWSDRSNPMLTIIADEIGRHDFLYAACSLEMYRIQYKVSGYHPNCHDNLSSALRDLGIEPHPLPSSFNFFMNATVASDGKLTIGPPSTQPGASMTLRAEMDLAVALSACPAVTCNGGQPARPLAYEIIAAI